MSVKVTVPVPAFGAAVASWVKVTPLSAGPLDDEPVSVVAVSVHDRLTRRAARPGRWLRRSGRSERREVGAHRVGRRLHRHARDLGAVAHRVLGDDPVEVRRRRVGRGVRERARPVRVRCHPAVTAPCRRRSRSSRRSCAARRTRLGDRVVGPGQGDAPVVPRAGQPGGREGAASAAAGPATPAASCPSPRGEDVAVPDVLPAEVDQLVGDGVVAGCPAGRCW